jgi:hypothetical protein
VPADDPPADVQALVDVVVRVSVLAEDLGWQSHRSVAYQDADRLP